MEVVSFLTFLEGKISELLFQIFFLSGIVFLLIFYDVDSSFIILSAVLFLSAQISFLWFSFQKKQKDSQRIINLADELQESYYISDILPKPGDPQNKAYYYALKKACKAMNDKISQIEKEKQEYEEYVESFAHEIKIPIGALSLTFDNTKNYALKKETDKLYRLTEQMLYYARSESTEKDYFVKKLNLEEVIHNVILKFRHDLIDHKVIIETHAIDQIVYTCLLYTSLLRRSIHIRKMLRNAGMCVKTVNYIKQLCKLRRLFRKICRASSAKNQYVDLIFPVCGVIHTAYRNSFCQNCHA